MAASRIFARLAELLDVNVTRAAAVWLRLNADGSTSQLTAAETLGDLGAASISGTNNFTGIQSFAQPVYLSGAVLGVIPTPIAGAYNGPGTGLTGNAANLSVGGASSAGYATTAGTANALAGILPISSGGTGGASESAARTALKVPGSLAGVGGSIAITNIVSISLANYNLIGTKDPTTLYVIA